MAREKRINLFNKNHVTFTKHINMCNGENELVFTGHSWSRKKNDCGNFKCSNTEKRIDCWVNKTEYTSSTTVVVQPATKKRIVERLKSPLGFYKKLNQEKFYIFSVKYELVFNIIFKYSKFKILF